MLRSKHAEEQLALVAEKDAKIEMLKQRVDSVNAEYNKAWNKGAQAPKPTREATTLEDVYRVTGEGNVR